VYDGWRGFVRTMSPGGDRVKIEAGVAVLAKLLGRG
jgi:hypothetical protein